MADPTTQNRLKGLVLSAAELRKMTDWPESLIEDYLNILRNLIIIADLLDIEIDQTLEEVPTDFTDGSVPYVDTGFLVEDNTNFFWDAVAEVLKVKGIILNDATASRLLATDASKEAVSVAALTAWIAGTANQVLITDDLDGTITISIPDTDVTGAELETLTDDSMADALHRHSELSGSDGTPNPSVSVDADGNTTFAGNGIFADGSKITIDCDTAFQTYIKFGSLADNDAYFQIGALSTGTTMTMRNKDLVIRSDTYSPIVRFEHDNGRVSHLYGKIDNTTRIINTDSPYTVLVTDRVIFCDTDGGAIECDLPAGVEGTNYKLINCGSSGNDLTIDPNGTEQVWGGGAGVAFALIDGDVLDLHYNATEGWW